MKLFTKILLHKPGRCGHPVKIGIEVFERHQRGHLLVSDNGIELVFAEFGTLLIAFLVDIHLVDDTSVRELVVCFEFLRRDFLLQLRGVIGLHQLLNRCFLLLIRRQVLRRHPHRTKLHTVQLGREIPVIGILV